MRRVVNAWRADPHSQGNQPTLPQGLAKEEAITFSAHKTRGIRWKSSRALTAPEAQYVEMLTHQCPQIAEAGESLRAFPPLVTQRCLAQRDPWLERCEHSGISEIVGFAQGIRRDDAAVRAALRYEWCHGQTEGQVNRLKTLKPQMYGRASFPLFRRRVLAHGALAP